MDLFCICISGILFVFAFVCMPNILIPNVCLIASLFLCTAFLIATLEKLLKNCSDKNKENNK